MFAFRVGYMLGGNHAIQLHEGICVDFRCAPAQSGAITLYKVVHDVISRLVHNPGLVDVFVLKLASIGYIDMQEYEKIHFVISAKQYYVVNDTFPRLTRSNVPTEITNAEYQIDLPSIASWSR